MNSQLRSGKQIRTDVKKTELIYGFHPVNEALKAARRQIYKLFLAKDKKAERYESLVTTARALGIFVEMVNASQLAHMAGSDAHQGIGAETGPYPFAQLSDITDVPEFIASNPFLLLLDNVLDPHNLGALVRTALCAGVNGVVIPKDRAAAPTPLVSKTSAGAIEHVRIARVTNMASTINSLKESGLWIAGMDKSAEKSIFDSNLSGPTAVVIGGEENGIRPLVKKQCDFLMSIPQIGQFDSLNASVAGAVVLYETFRQRHVHQQL